MTLREMIRRLRWLGWIWREISEKSGDEKDRKSITWVHLVAHGRYKPPEKIATAVARRLEEEMRKLPRQLWQATEELEAEVLAEIRDNHVGIKRAIKSRYLAIELGTTDRMIRACVNSLRKKGHPICSSVGENAGFWFPASRREYEEFKHRDYLSRIKDMQRVMDAMDLGAEKYFAGQWIEVELQPELIPQAGRP
jgi:hypothetical protein